MAARPLVFHPDSIEEALAARQWYEARSPAARDAFLAELEHAFEQIVEAPERWPSHSHGTRRFLLRRFPFSIVYRESAADIQIIAVAHGRRRPAYWKQR